MDGPSAAPEPLTVFISARVREMTAERLAAGAAVAAMRLRPVLFEHTRPSAPGRPVFLEAARTCDVFVGLYGDEYGDTYHGGPSPIEQEFMETLAVPLLPRLLFLRRGRRRRHALQRFLDLARSEAVLHAFTNHEDLGPALRRALAALLADAHRDLQVLPAPRSRPDLDSPGPHA